MAFAPTPYFGLRLSSNKPILVDTTAQHKCSTFHANTDSTKTYALSTSSNVVHLARISLICIGLYSVFLKPANFISPYYITNVSLYFGPFILLISRISTSTFVAVSSFLNDSLDASTILMEKFPVFFFLRPPIAYEAIINHILDEIFPFTGSSSRKE